MIGVKSRAVIFVHYDRDGLVEDYVLFYLRSLRTIFDFVIFISTASLSSTEQAKAHAYADIVVVRDNVGYDFCSYKAGLHLLKERGLERYSEVALCNDSVYGPLYPLKDVFKKMDTAAADFWGITDSEDEAPHLQSYFLVFRQQVILSSHFWEFWKKLEVLDNKSEIISRYEIGLTQFLKSKGFTSAAFVNYKPYILQAYARRIISQPGKVLRLIAHKLIPKWVCLMKHLSAPTPNPTLLVWRELIQYEKMPFLKVGLLRNTRKQKSVADYPEIIKRFTTYDVGLIKKHLNRVKARTP